MQATQNLTLQNDWYRASFALLNKTLAKEQRPFCQAVNTLYAYVIEKSNGRCTSKKIRDATKRELLISELFNSYVKDASAAELCNTRFMRKLVKHDHSNNEHLDFIDQEITPFFYTKLYESETLTKDPNVRSWLKDLSAAIYEPQALQEQEEFYRSIPDAEYRKKLTEGRMQIGRSFKEAVLNGWIDGDAIEQIRQTLLEKVTENSTVELTKDTAVAHFVYRYRKLIATGDQYAEQYCQAIHQGLYRFKLKEYEILKNSTSISAN